MNNTILITGASSGLGAALARHYAAPGVTLSLWGRDEARLSAVAAECQAKGAKTHLRLLDLAESEKLLPAPEEEADVTLALLCAAQTGGWRRGGAAKEILRLGLVNYVATTVLASGFAQSMAARGSGQIVIVGSVAGFFPLPHAPGYSGSKAGLLRFAQALRAAYAPRGVGITMVSPGFIDTPMSAPYKGARPGMISAEEAAQRIARAAASNRAHLVMPWWFRALRALAVFVPAGLYRR